MNTPVLTNLGNLADIADEQIEECITDMPPLPEFVPKSMLIELMKSSFIRGASWQDRRARSLINLKGNADLTHALYTSLKAMPCRCQYDGGAKWHFRSQATISQQCSRCKAIEDYERDIKG